MPISRDGNSRGACDKIFTITEDSSIDWLSPPVRLICIHILDILQVDEIHLAHFFEIMIDTLEYNRLV